MMESDPAMATWANKLATKPEFHVVDTPLEIISPKLSFIASTAVFSLKNEDRWRIFRPSELPQLGTFIDAINPVHFFYPWIF